MNRREEIIFATLELASQKGLSNVSMAQIAEKMGIQKPSLYNHFKSKDEIIEAMYQCLREKSKERVSSSDIDYGEFIKNKSLEEVLTRSVDNYRQMCTESNMLSFYKVIYSERAYNPNAAGIVAEETRKMIIATKNLFYALGAYQKINVTDIDIAATSFAMTIHGMIDYQIDCANSGEACPDEMISDYVKWFCNQYGGDKK